MIIDSVCNKFYFAANWKIIKFHDFQEILKFHDFSIPGKQIAIFQVLQVPWEPCVTNVAP